MFERRLKIFLAILLVFVLVLLGRAMELQVVQRDYWKQQASKSMQDVRLLPTSRGRILDRKGQVLACDEPCLDACVDYRIINSDNDQTYVRQLAINDVHTNELSQYKAANANGKKQLIQDQVDAINEKIRKMWIKLALLSGETEEQIQDKREMILNRVQFRRREVWNRKLDALNAEMPQQSKQPWYQKMLTYGEKDSNEDQEQDFKIEEEASSHVMLEAIDKATQNELLRHSDDYPGVELKAAMHRVYPFGEVGCHVIGHLRKVRPEEVTAGSDQADLLTRYRAADDIGADGLEALGEPTLRGALGCDVIDEDEKTNQVISTTDPKPGADLHTTIDIDLQQQVQAMFDHVHVPYQTTDMEHHFDDVPMHGAAVVIDVATDQVLAMASAPGFDPNHLDEQYNSLVHDNMNRPLVNRATQDQYEPGSTVKPMVGLGAITQGLLGVHEGIECTGYLIIGGKKYMNFGRCWTVAVCKTVGMDPAHHPVPYPHQGLYGNPDGFLIYADALERSCNVFFETTADRLKISGLDHWFGAFGLGRPTGIGIAEVCGTLPEDPHGPNTQFINWTAGIGQGQVRATPIQMANVAATIARRGIWMKPELVMGDEKISPYHPYITPPTGSTTQNMTQKTGQKSPTTQATGKKSDDWSNIPDQVDLHLSQAGIDEAFKGMINVVNGQSGTGTQARRSDMIVAGKSGTAQASPIWLPELDAQGHPILKADGNPQMAPMVPATHEHPQPDHPWYRATDEEGKKMDHAWFIGFAPANHPKYAICVMVEYAGGGGGPVSGVITRQILDALIEHGYLAANSTLSH